jgi:hypothetical protein
MTQAERPQNLPSWRAAGLLLMKHMIEFSRHKDLKTVRGQVLSKNSAMLAMCAELGFSH